MLLYFQKKFSPQLETPPGFLTGNKNALNSKGGIIPKVVISKTFEQSMNLELLDTGLQSQFIAYLRASLTDLLCESLSRKNILFKMAVFRSTKVFLL